MRIYEIPNSKHSALGGENWAPNGIPIVPTHQPNIGWCAGSSHRLLHPVASLTAWHPQPIRMSMTPFASRGKRKRSNRDQTPVSPGGDCRGAKYHCNYCNKDISNAVRIKCAVCPDFDLCVECFSVGVQVTPHKNSHDYRVVDDLSFPLFHPLWGADEELLLLEAIDMYGLGNWSSVAEHVGTKGDRECETHYYSVYIEPSTFPLPSPTPDMLGVDPLKYISDGRGGGERGAVGAGDCKRNGGGSRKAEKGGGVKLVEEEDTGGDAAVSEHSIGLAGSKGSGNDHAAGNQSQPSSNPRTNGEEAGEENPVEAATPPPKKSRVEEPEENKKGATVEAGGPQQVGGRRLHSKGSRAGKKGCGNAVEDDASNSVLADQKEVFVNSAEFTGYNPKRDEFDPDYDNDAELLVADLEFPVGEVDEIVRQKLKLLEVYNKRLDIREERKNFIIKRKLLNVKKQQAQEKRRTPEMNALHAALRVLARFHSQEEHEALVEGLYIESKLRLRIEELKDYRRNGYRTFAEAEVFDQERQRRQALGETRDKLGRFIAGSNTPRPAATAGSKATALVLQSWRSKRGVALDITPFPGVEHLTAKERELCANSRLVPAHYLALKDRLLREADKFGYFPRQEVKVFFRLEQNKALRVYDLLHSLGWVRCSPNDPPLKTNNGPAGAPTGNEREEASKPTAEKGC